MKKNKQIKGTIIYVVLSVIAIAIFFTGIITNLVLVSTENKDYSWLPMVLCGAGLIIVIIANIFGEWVISKRR